MSTQFVSSVTLPVFSASGANIFDSAQDSDAWTLAYLFELNEHWQRAAEALHVSGSLAQRVLLGLPASATELQLAARFTF